MPGGCLLLYLHALSAVLVCGGHSLGGLQGAASGSIHTSVLLAPNTHTHNLPAGATTRLLRNADQPEAQVAAADEYVAALRRGRIT